MKHLTRLLLPLLLVVLFVSPVSAHSDLTTQKTVPNIQVRVLAHHTIPDYLNCAYCSSYNFFNHASGIQGMSVLQVLNPANRNNCTLTCYWGLYIAVVGSANNRSKSSFIVGIEESNTAAAGYCGSTSFTLHWVIIAYDDSGTPVDGTCSDVTTTGQQTWNIGPYVSNGGGIQGFINATSGTVASLQVPYSFGVDHTYYNMWSWEEYANNNTGANEPRSSILNYAYYKNGAYNFQTGNPTQQSAGDPPQWYWNVDPYHSTNGGWLYHCINYNSTGC